MKPGWVNGEGQGHRVFGSGRTWVALKTPVIPVCLDPSIAPLVALSAKTLQTVFLSGLLAPHQGAIGKPD